MSSPLAILDRDGVINFDSDAFIKSPDEWLPIPGSLEAIARLHQAGWRVVVASNQSGIGRGLMDEDALEAIHRRMEQAVTAAGGHFDGIYYCPHHPDEGCKCRKPLPGLLEAIATHFDMSLENVPVIGDSARDLEAADAAGANPVLVLTGNGQKTRAGLPGDSTIPVYADLSAAVDNLLAADQ
ncbi:MAG: D-glycero-beta-D-manno-heptose 1,7-bisphosphate 7-phosphatase [Proteobacteria bacterium]|nr:D-glycero-beta-D-manno-heptose 1,7-bisphosphate 7-phosphatase [Pseudomonadota bacterium]